MKTKTKYEWIGLAVVLAAYVLCLPPEIFRGVPYSTGVESAEGELLGARVADDGQWRSVFRSHHKNGHVLFQRFS